jgi:hypothetical protein
MATSDERAKNRVSLVRASWSSVAAKGTQQSGRPPGRRKWGVAKTLPSAEKYPDERSAKKWSARSRRGARGPRREHLRNGPVETMDTMNT